MRMKSAANWSALAAECRRRAAAGPEAQRAGWERQAAKFQAFADARAKRERTDKRLIET